MIMMRRILTMTICHHKCRKRNERREYHLHRCNSLQIHIDRMIFFHWHRNGLSVEDLVIRRMHRLNNQLFFAQSVVVAAAAVVTAPQPPLSPHHEFEPV